MREVAPRAIILSMELPKEAVEDLMARYEAFFGELLEYEEARQIGERLITLYRLMIPYVREREMGDQPRAHSARPEP